MRHVDPFEDGGEEIRPQEPPEHGHGEGSPVVGQDRPLLQVEDQGVLLVIEHLPSEEAEDETETELTVVLVVDELVKLQLVEQLILTDLPVASKARGIDDYRHLEVVILNRDHSPKLLL